MKFFNYSIQTWWKPLFWMWFGFRHVYWYSRNYQQYTSTNKDQVWILRINRKHTLNKSNNSHHDKPVQSKALISIWYTASDTRTGLQVVFGQTSATIKSLKWTAQTQKMYRINRQNDNKWSILYRSHKFIHFCCLSIYVS